MYERENQIDSFKSKIKPIVGRSLKDKEFNDIFSQKDGLFEKTIKERFESFRQKRIEVDELQNNIQLK